MAEKVENTIEKEKKKLKLRKNYIFLRELWKVAHPEDSINGLWELIGISESEYHKCTSRKADIPSLTDEKIRAKNEQLRKWFKGEEEIPTKIPNDIWDSYRNEKNNRSRPYIQKQVKDTYTSRKPRIPFNQVNTEKADDMDRLLYYIEYKVEMAATGTEKLNELLELLKRLHIGDFFFCKDTSLMKELLAASKEKMEQIETVYRACELNKRRHEEQHTIKGNQ